MHRYSIGIILVVVSFTCGALTVLTNVIAVSTDYWIHVSELVSFTDFEHDFNAEEITFASPIHVISIMGLWRLCILTGDQSCVCLDYTVSRSRPKELVISLAECQREATPFFMTSLVLVIISGICNILGNARWSKVTIATSFYYILSAIFIVVGMAIYIANVNDTSKTFKTSQMQKLPFRYRYGWSFWLMWLCLFFCVISSIVCAIIGCRERKSTVREITDDNTLKEMDGDSITV